MPHAGEKDLAVPAGVYPTGKEPGTKSGEVKSLLGLYGLPAKTPQRVEKSAEIAATHLCRRGSPGGRQASPKSGSPGQGRDSPR
jgi:hypothetical protein